MSINLLPAELTSGRRQQDPRTSWPFVLVICCFCISLIGYAYLSVKIGALEDQKKAWQGLLSERDRLRVQLEALEEEIFAAYEEQAALETALSTGTSLTGVLTLLQHHFPLGLQVKQVTISGEGWAIVYGEARSLESITRLAASLGSDSYFTEVKVTSLYLDRDTGVHRFTIQLLISGNKVDSSEV